MLCFAQSRLQAKQDSDQVRRYSGTVDAISKIARHEGVAGFYKVIQTPQQLYYLLKEEKQEL